LLPVTSEIGPIFCHPTARHAVRLPKSNRKDMAEEEAHDYGRKRRLSERSFDVSSNDDYGQQDDDRLSKRQGLERHVHFNNGSSESETNREDWLNEHWCKPNTIKPDTRNESGEEKESGNSFQGAQLPIHTEQASHGTLTIEEVLSDDEVKDEDNASPLESPPMIHDATRRLCYRAVPTSHIPESRDSFVTVNIRLPYQFGVQFLVDSVMGQNRSLGRALCDKYSCLIDFEETRIAETENSQKYRKDNMNHIGVNLTGPSIQKLFDCRLQIESNLFDAIPPRLRGCFLTCMAWNSYRQRDKGIAHIPNPFLEHKSDDPGTFLHVAYLQFCNRRTRVRLDIDRVEQFKSELEARYLCRIEAVKCDPRFGVRTHVLVCGEKFVAVDQCRSALTHLYEQHNPQRVTS